MPDQLYLSFWQFLLIWISQMPTFGLHHHMQKQMEEQHLDWELKTITTTNDGAS